MKTKFTYKSNCTRNSISVPFATDANQFQTKAKALHYMKNLETGLAVGINEQLERGTMPDSYYILGDFTVIATAANYDDASLIAEALAKHSPLYERIDVMSANGLIIHYLCKDFNNDKTNHLQEKRHESSQFLCIRLRDISKNPPVVQG